MKPETHIDFLVSIQDTLKRYPEHKQSQFRALLMSIIDRKLDQDTKRAVLIDWWSEMHSDLRREWEAWPKNEKEEK